MAYLRGVRASASQQLQGSSCSDLGALLKSFCSRCVVSHPQESLVVWTVCPSVPPPNRNQASSPTVSGRAPPKALCQEPISASPSSNSIIHLMNQDWSFCSICDHALYPVPACVKLGTFCVVNEDVHGMMCGCSVSPDAHCGPEMTSGGVTCSDLSAPVRSCKSMLATGTACLGHSRTW